MVLETWHYSYVSICVIVIITIFTFMTITYCKLMYCIETHWHLLDISDRKPSQYF